MNVNFSLMRVPYFILTALSDLIFQPTPPPANVFTVSKQLLHFIVLQHLFINSDSEVLFCLTSDLITSGITISIAIFF